VPLAFKLISWIVPLAKLIVNAEPADGAYKVST
jgi:hypothetical protein